MDRQQAERSLAIIRSVIEDTRDDLVERNWGIFWIILLFINFTAAAGGTWFDRHSNPVSLAYEYEVIVDFYDALSLDPHTNELFILGIDHSDWNVQVLKPVDYYLGYFAAGPIPEGAAKLDCAFYFCDAPYRWLPLLRERIRSDESERCDEKQL